MSASGGETRPESQPATPLVTRPAEEQDYPALAAMYEQLNAYFYQVGYTQPVVENVGQVWLDSFKRTMGRFSNVFVADAGDSLTGFALCRLKRLPPHMGGALVGEISDIWVDPPARGEGVGEALAQMAIEWLQAQGAQSVEAQILRDNEVSWKFFERLGFRLEVRVVRRLWDAAPEQPAG